MDYDLLSLTFGMTTLLVLLKRFIIFIHILLKIYILFIINLGKNNINKQTNFNLKQTFII